MSFNIDNYIVERILYGWAEDFSGNIAYTLSQLSTATINITAESKDALDAQNMLVKRFWQNKTGEFTATNATINFNIIGAMAGGLGKEVASNTNILQMPKIITGEAGTTLDIHGYIDGTVEVNGYDIEVGNVTKKYIQGGEPSATEYAISAGELTLPLSSTDSHFIVKYIRNVDLGIRISNRSNRFPRAVCLNLKCIGIDPCEPDLPQIIYIQVPHFQPSPDIEIGLTTEQTLDYSGQMMKDYCSEDHVLYSIYAVPESEEAVGYLSDGMNFMVADRDNGDLTIKQLVDHAHNTYQTHSYLKKFLRENYALV